MPVEVIVPKVDMDMETATIEAWKVADGQSVKAGEAIFEIGTNKAVMEIEAPASGIVCGITGATGEAIPVGTVVAWIYREGECHDAGRSPPAAHATALAAVPLPVAADIAPMKPQAATTAGLRATPLARRLSRLNGLDLSSIKGSGPRGRVSSCDVLPLIGSARPPEPVRSPELPGDDGSAGRLLPFSSLRRLVAQRLGESMRTAPHFYMTSDIDMTALADLRARKAGKATGDAPARLSLTVIVACIVGRLLARHPMLNASVEGDAVRMHTAAHIGIAMDRAGELVVPVLRNANSLTLGELAAEFERLRSAAMARTIASAEMRGGTFTISNLGMFGVDAFTAIINPPEAAILAIGRTVEAPAARNGQVVIRPQAAFTLSSDHRIVDGVTAGRFMADLRDALENPGMLL